MLQNALQGEGEAQVLVRGLAVMGSNGRMQRVCMPCWIARLK